LEKWGRYLALLAGFVLPAPQNDAADQSDELSSQVI
jgi:hypothetical protein